MSPSSANLGAGQTQKFTATVTGLPNAAVSWALSPAGAGTVDSAGSYTAPAVIPTQQTVNITATSVANSSKSASSTMTLTPLRISMSPSSANLYAGQTQQFSASIQNSNNTGVTWSILPAQAGSISASGLYTTPAVIPAQTKVTVTAASAADPSKTTSASVTLIPLTISMSPSSANLNAGQTQSFSAQINRSNNTAVSWSINPAAGAISPAGVYQAPAVIGSERAVTVSAASVADPSKTASATVSLLSPITVTPANAALGPLQTQQYTAKVTGLGNTAVTWSINPAVGSISSAGLYTAPGSIVNSQTINVIATSVGDSSKQALATATLNSPIAVTVAPARATLNAGGTQQFSATVAGSANTAISWSISPAGKGTISAAGLYTAPATIATQISVTITASSQADPTKTAGAIVLLQPVSVSVAPATAALYSGQTQQFSASVTGSPNVAVTWSIAPVGAGSISATGLYTSPSAISTQTGVTVTAASQADISQAATAAITLNPPVSVTVSPNPASLNGGGTQQFTATVVNAANTNVVWSVTPPGLGSISTSGLYTAPAIVVSNQLLNVAAASAADPAQVASAILDLAPVSISISPATASLYVAQTQQFTATVSGASNAAIAWAVSPANAGTISSAGLFSASGVLSPTTAIVTATSVSDPGKSTTSSVLISPLPAMSISPNQGRAGQTVRVAITGVNTNFSPGTTQASFGTGTTAAPDAADGQFGLITVTSPTAAIATVLVASAASIGPRDVTLQTGAETVSVAAGFNVTAGLPTINISAPQSVTFTNTTPVTVRGTVSDPTATILVNGIAAPNSGGTFTAAVPLVEGSNTILATATTAAHLVGSQSLEITLDTTPPRVAISSPASGAAITAPSVTVSGFVNDVVVGTVNDQQATVTVNGSRVTVSNRTFTAPNIPLQVGDNTITVIATDRSGNSNTVTLPVKRLVQTQPEIRAVSGDSQFGAISSRMAVPLTVRLVDAAGTPQPGKQVLFKVVQGNASLDGGPATVSAFSTAGITPSVLALTNSQGQASVNWTLGTRAGAGNNRVEATATGFSGAATFFASATPGAPAQINVDAGSGQTGVAGTPLGRPFVAVVTDAGHNRLPNVPVSFTVSKGDGTLGGQTTVIQNTDSDGRAQVVLTLGPLDGIASNVVDANYSGSTCSPASFSATAKTPGDPAATRITGVVLDNTNTPVPGVTMRLFQPYQAQLNNVPVAVAPPATTDAQGQFVISPAPVGAFKLMADGSTAARPGSWPTLEYDIVAIAGQTNTVGLPIYLLPIDSAHQICVGPATGGTLTLPALPGFSLTVQPGSATFPGGARSGCISVTLVHLDKVPMVPAFGQQPSFVVTLQPPGVLLNPAAAITFPNVIGLKPRDVTEIYSFDHDLNSFVSIGTATASDDGSILQSDPGTGVVKTGWQGAGAPPPPTCAGTCPPCRACRGENCNSNPALDGTRARLGSCCFQGDEWPLNAQSYSLLTRVCPRRQQNNRPHEVDGCSVPGVVALVTPGLSVQNPTGGIDGLVDSSFGANQGTLAASASASSLPCNQHDICYQTCQSTQTACDNAMSAAMTNVCAAAYPTSTCPYTGNQSSRCTAVVVNGIIARRGYFIEKNDCRNWAAVYSTGLAAFGESPWRQRQLDYCKCCP